MLTLKKSKRGFKHLYIGRLLSAALLVALFSTLFGFKTVAGTYAPDSGGNTERGVSSSYHALQGQQGSVVSGHIVDQSGESLAGTSVIVKGTSQGTITDIDGNYSISGLKGNETLVFSFLGMASQEIAIGGRAVIDITLLPSSVVVDDVVVTALGIQRETKALGYAMTKVSGDDVAGVNTVNPVQALQGKSSGLSIGGSDGGLFGNSKIQLRGVSVLNSNNNQPIFVIDGVILDNSVSGESADWSSVANDFGNVLKNLNPDDYESVSVLKGAAATALYGSRGINGAIVIKTKDGKKAARGIGVKVTQSFGVDHVYGEPAIQYEYGPGTIAGYISYGEQDENGRYYKFDTNQFYTVDGVPTKINHPASSLFYGPRYDGREIVDFDGTMTTYRAYPSLMKSLYDTGWNSNTSLVLTGGSEKGSFYLSNSYNYRKGSAPRNEFTRNALLLNASYNLATWLTTEASISYTISNPKNPRSEFGSQILDGSFTSWYDVNKWRKQEVWQAPHGGRPNSDYNDQYANVPGNSKWFSLYMDEYNRREYVTRPIVRLTARLADWISVTAEGNMNYYTYDYEVKELGQGYYNEGGKYLLEQRSDVTTTGKLTANITRELSSDISASLLVGGEIWSQRIAKTKVETDGGLVVPGQFFLENSQKTIKYTGEISGTKQINSLYYLLSLTWKNQIFLDVTGRNDWSSAMVYTGGAGDYSYFYPSVSTSWVFTDSFRMPDWVSFGKTRLSWAQVGNDTGAYNINKGYSIGHFEMENGLIFTNTRNPILVDNTIKPERKNSIEAGVDARFLDNRIGFDFTYYNEAITNQIGTIPLPDESGHSDMLSNIGTLKNYGIELSVRGVPVRTGDFEWVSTFNYWNNTTMVSDLREEVANYKKLGGDTNYGNFRVGSVAFENGEYGVLLSDSKAAVTDDGEMVLTWNESYRGAYLTRSYEEEEVGKIQPDFEGSWDNSFHWKSISLSILIDARFGGHIASYSSKYGTSYGILEESLYARDAKYGGIEWTSSYADSYGQTFYDGVIPDGVFKEGTEVTTPSGSKREVGGMTYQEAYDAGYVEPTHASYWTYRNNSWSTGVVNDSWLAEVNYIALRNISIGYTMPKKWAYKAKAQNVYMALNARNLGYIYNSLPNNINPESFRGTTSTESFRERSFSPYTASYTFTISVDF